MRVLFLDIDGVMNSQASAIYWNRKGLDNGGFSKRHGAFCPIAVSNLTYLLEEVPDLKIVVSSTWRLGETTESMREILKELAGVDPERVIGLTPSMRDFGLESAPEERKEFLRYWLKKYSYNRGLEISWYLLQHPEVTHFVILDDDSDMGALLPFLCKTNFRDGLTQQKTLEIMQRLSFPWVSTAGMYRPEGVVPTPHEDGYLYYGPVDSAKYREKDGWLEERVDSISVVAKSTVTPPLFDRSIFDDRT